MIRPVTVRRNKYRKYDGVQAYLVLEIINTSKINEELLLLLTLLLAFHLLLTKILVVHFLGLRLPPPPESQPAAPAYKYTCIKKYPKY